MQVAVENTSSIGRRLTVTVPRETVQLEIVRRTQVFKQKGKLPGFRAGKVPDKLIQEKFGVQIREEAVSQLIESTLSNALKQESLEPAGRPELESVNPVLGSAAIEDKDMVYVVNFEIYPEVNLPDFKTLTVEQYSVDITDADVKKALEHLQNQTATWHAVNRPIKEGDKVLVDYTSLLDGKPYKDNSGKDVSVEIGSKTFIDGFESGLIGAIQGETRELTLSFPKEWRLQNLAGKPVVFSITVKAISEKTVTELDEAFAQRIGAAKGDRDSIELKIRENLEQQVAHARDEAVKRNILTKVIEAIALPLPKALIEREVALLHEDLHRRHGGHTHQTCHHEGLDTEAKRRLATTLVLQKVIKLEKLTLDSEKVRQKINEISASFGNAEFIEKMYYESKELLANIQNSVLVDQAIDCIAKQVSFVSKPVTVEALFNLV